MKRIAIKRWLLWVCMSLLFKYSLAQQNKLIVVTLDGMRWQEVFTGADKALLTNPAFTKDTAGCVEAFWAAKPTERRKKLFPFLWSVVAQQGTLMGNRLYNNCVNISNPYNFSYPGYNEIFTGYPDKKVNSNDKIANPNTNVLEFINQQPGFENKVAVFATWDVMPYILNKWRSGLYINAGEDTVQNANSQMQLLHTMQQLTAKPIDVRPDIMTYMLAKEYMKQQQPKVLYISFDETDDFAHHGMYDQYLKSAQAQDKMLADLWNYVQADSFYRNQTNIIITCDHGRGSVKKKDWVDHGDEIPESNQIWIAMMGPQIPALGEAKQKDTVYQKQLASSMAALVGLQFTANHPVASPLAIIPTENKQTLANSKQ